MKLLPSYCLHQAKVCVATGLLIASSAFVATAAETEAPAKAASPQKAATQQQPSAEPRRLVVRRKSKPVTLTDFITKTFSNKPKRTRNTSSYRKPTPAPAVASTPKQATPSAIQQTAGKQSNIQKELEALYSKNGRQMPSMQLKDAPNTHTPGKSGLQTRSMQRPGTTATTPAPVQQPATTAAPVQTKAEPRRLQTRTQPQQQQQRYQTHQQRYQPQSSRKKPTFLQRLFGKKSRTNSRRQPYRRKPLPQQRSQQRFVQQPKQQRVLPTPAPVAAPAVTAPAVVASQVAKQMPAAPAVPVENSYAVPPAPVESVVEKTVVKKDAVAEKEAAPKTIATETKTALVNNETPAAKPKQTVNSLDNPFPELSENEADGVKETTPEPKIVKEEAPKKPTPFTGLVLKEKAEEEDQTISGLKGFCIVKLRDDRQLVDGKEDFLSTYQGKLYLFSSETAQNKFEENPAKYAPVKSGRDVISLAGGDDTTAGSLDYAVWYKSKLYLFSTQNNLNLFVQTPRKFYQK